MIGRRSVLIRLLSSSFYSSRISYDPPPRISPRAANDPVPTWSLIELELVFTSTGIARMAVNWLTRESLGGLEVFLLGLSGPGLQSWIKIANESCQLAAISLPELLENGYRVLPRFEMIMFSNRTVQIEESEEPVRLRSVGTHSASHHQLVACKRLRSVSCCFDFEFLQNLLQPLFPPSPPPITMPPKNRQAREGKGRRPRWRREVYAARRDALDAESLDTFRQDFGIPDEIELVCRLRARTRNMFVRGFAAPTHHAPELRPPRDRMCGSSSGRGRLVRCSRLRKLFSVKNNTRLPGSFYSSPRPNRRIFTNTPQRDSGWSDEMFFFRVSEATMGDFDFGRIRTEWATSVVVDPVPNNPGIDYLVERLGREKVNWSTFTPERIRRVLSSPPAPPPADLPVRSAQDSSSASSVPPLSRRSKMPRRQPLRSRTAKGAKGASSGGSRVRAGEFVTAVEEAMASKPTAGSSALADQVVDQVDATAEGEIVPLPSTVHVSSDRTRSSDQGHSRQASKRARSDDGRARSREGGPTASNGSGGKPPFYWQYENSRGFPVQDDEEGTARIQLHFKPVGCRLPSLNQMSEKELYIATCAASGRAVAARNMLVSRLESRIRDAPQQKELDQVKELVAKLTSDLSAANERVARQGELLKKHTSQEGRVKELETREADLLRQLSQNQEQMAALQKESSSALTQSLRLSRENQVLVAEKDNIARRANRAGRREMVAKHREVLESAKAKFEEKRVEGGRARQVEGARDEVAEAAKAAQVSDFSIGKFNLPVVSEDSVARMEIDPSTSIPVGLNPFGTNAEEKGSNEEEEKEDEEMTVED
ncbi:unnamed protein product [Microthlaspi erraticum]|uniref:Uncharacterized protein n=1 Tax=Microthlaspi erraticum TaxID=1685480 RepID=A0A6D2HIS3_9BRAS|nr:unnamed protein product [Microthlaspi erraticum]